MNPLLGRHKFIPFDKFTITDLEDAITKYLNLCKKSLHKLEKLKEVSWEELNQFLYLPLYKFNQLWGLVDHLLAVDDNKNLRALQAKLQPLITEFHINISQNKIIYNHYKYLKAHQFNNLDLEAKKVIDDELHEFFLNGVELNNAKKETLKVIKSELNELYTKFEQNVLDSINSFTKYVTFDELSGLPEDILQLLKNQAKEDGRSELYKVTLQMTCYLPIMQYCDNRDLREELYYEFTTIASELSKNKSFDNTQIIYKILNLRLALSNLLGFKDYNELSLYTKMANNTNQILNFLHQLAQKSKSQALLDVKELKVIATKFGIDNLKIWDTAYLSEKLQQEKFAYSQNELKQYFQLPIVLKGLFSLINKLYQVEFLPSNTIPVWNEQVQTFKVVKAKQTIGYLYLDLYVRPHKQSGAWMNSAQDRFNYKNYNLKPMAYIICNFTPPINDQASLLTFEDVQTIFHEMGHAIHHLLTNINHYAIAGINKVEWDAVEMPSQFMEYFTWNYSVLSSISKHVETGVSIPLDLYNKLLNSRFFQSALHMLRQLEFAIFDLSIHERIVPNDYLSVLTTIRKEITVIDVPSYNRFPNSFSHVFAGGYASGYYSYKWAELLAADIFEVFDNAGIDKYSEIGNKFLTTILARGSLHKMLDNFKEFRGRLPKIDALLKYSNIT